MFPVVSNTTAISCHPEMIELDHELPPSLPPKKNENKGAPVILRKRLKKRAPAKYEVRDQHFDVNF